MKTATTATATAESIVSKPHDARALEAHRAALTGHCYRMLGSAAEADDAVQETMVRGWRALDKFDGRASLRSWLTRIATRVCLDALADRQKRARPVESGPMGSIAAPLVRLPAEHWVEPIPDASALPADADPSELVVLRQSIRLAFVAALQHLPPRQRAILLLTEVMGWPASEVAESLELSVAAVNSALQRARATLGTRDLEAPPAALSAAQSELLGRYVSAFERYDVPELTRLLHEEATLSMPPYDLWLRGHDLIGQWLLGPGSGCRGSRLVPVAASGQPAFAQYRVAAAPEQFRAKAVGSQAPTAPSEVTEATRAACGGRPDSDVSHEAFSLIVLELTPSDDVGGPARIASMTHYLDVDVQFPRFGVPLRARF